MKTVISFGIALLLVGFAQLEDPRRHVNDIHRHAQHWFNTSSAVFYTKIVHHETFETRDGGKVCYRAIHPAFVDVICLGWKNGKVINLDTYRIKS